MSKRSGRNAPRKPAIKFAHLRRKMEQNKLQAGLHKPHKAR